MKRESVCNNRFMNHGSKGVRRPYILLWSPSEALFGLSPHVRRSNYQDWWLTIGKGTHLSTFDSSFSGNVAKEDGDNERGMEGFKTTAEVWRSTFEHRGGFSTLARDRHL